MPFQYNKNILVLSNSDSIINFKLGSFKVGLNFLVKAELSALIGFY